MANKKKEEIIVTPEDFPAYLHGWMVSHGYPLGTEEQADSIKRFADYLGVKRELVYMMLKSGRAPSSAVREKVDLETVWRVKQTKAKK